MAGIEALARLPPHQVGGLGLDVGLRDRKLHALVAADRTVEDDALVRVACHAVDEPVGVTDALGGDQRPLGVEAVEQVAESPALLADAVIQRNLETVEEQLVRLVVDHVVDRPDGKAASDRLADVDNIVGGDGQAGADKGKGNGNGKGGK